MDSDFIKAIWPDWEIVEVLGKGSFGTVYKAKRDELGSTFFSAIKVITVPQSESEIAAVRADGVDNESTRAYFKSCVDDWVNEIKLMESLKATQNIVSVEDYKVVEHADKIGWDIYIRMELLTSFTDYVGEKTLDEDEIIRLGIDICSALEFCSKLNILHRDIKPENIFVSKFGIFKLGDFGVARQLEKTNSGLSKKGTYHYMAPEVYNGKPYTSNVDTYSLAIVLYKLINDNRTPFLPPYPQQITFQDKEDALTRRLNGDSIPAPSKASNELAAIILKACSYNPSSRYNSPLDMKNELQRVLGIKDRTHNGEVVQQANTIFCAKCGAPQQPGVSFCKKCGNKLTASPAPVSLNKNLGTDFDKTTAVRKAPVNTGAQAQQKPDSETESFDTPNKKNEKKTGKRKVKVPLIIAIVVLVLALAGGGTYFAMNLGDEEKATEAGVTVTEESTLANNTDTTDVFTTLPVQEESTATLIAENPTDTVAVNIGYKYDEYSTPLGDIKITNSNSLLTQTDISESYIMDTIGDIYLNSGDLFGLKAYCSDNPGYMEFYTGKQYKKLAGVISIADNSDNMTGEIEIYADDELVYSSGVKSRASEPFAVNINITGKDWIKIKFVGKEGEYNIYALLSNFLVSKSADTKGPTAPKPKVVVAGAPTKISSLNLVNCDRLEKIVDRSIDDTVGNKYGSNNLYTLNAYDSDCYGYLELYTGKQAKKISGTIAIADGSDDMKGEIEIYADDTLIYSSGVVGRTTVPFDVNVTITGATWVKVMLKGVEGDYNLYAILYDFELS